MTVIRPNSITGVTSITAQGDTLTLHSSDGTLLNELQTNINASSGVSTVANLDATNINITGVSTVANLDATNINITGISTFGSSNGIGTVTIGVGTEALYVDGNARVVGILTVGRSSVTIDGTNNRIGVGSALPQTTLDLSQETGGIALPQGTTAQRPTGDNPYLRWNSSNNALEFYNGSNWVEIISDYFPTGSMITPD